MYINKKDLIESINKLNNEICKLIEPNIREIIETYVKDEKSYKLIKSKTDIKGSNSFYMIFSDNISFTNKGCKIQCNHKSFYCVYRGHSYHTKERLLSHLFYESNSKYQNCMKIMLNSKKYNINIEEQTLYLSGKKTSADFPKGEWIVIRIPLDNSKQAIREMFETVFDNKYGKPVFSEK